jgi:oligopeptide transport system substrate-binding protein
MNKNISRYLLALVSLLAFACNLSFPPSTAQPGQNGGTQSGGNPITENTFVNDELGVRIDVPQGWKKEAGTDQGVIVDIDSGQGLVSRLLFSTSAADDTPQKVAEQLVQELGSELKNIQTVSSAAFSLNSGEAGWKVVFTGSLDDGTGLKLSAIVTLHGSQSYVLLTFGLASTYDSEEAKVDAMAATLAFQAPIINGVPRDQALILSGGESTNPREYDPATMHSSGDKRVFGGLVSLDPGLNVTPELAESWDVSPDGTVYTFHLRQNAVFHDGRAVTAQDVVYSWERAANPELQSDTVLTYLGDIVGVKDMADGKATSISGLKVLDDHTLQVTIDAPKPYFLLKLTYAVAFVVDKANVESGEEWYRTPNGTGPYKLTRWDRFQLMVYEANKDFYLGTPSIPYVIVKLYSGDSMRMYEAGEIDISGVPAYDVARVLDPAEPLHADLRTGVELCTSYIVFDTTRPPFDDARVRQAFTMAFDRQKYIDVILHGAALPARGIYPPGLPGYNTELKGLDYDPEAARDLLRKSKYGGPKGLPQIVFTSGGIGSDIGADVAAMAQMWQQNLGVTITVENLEPDRYYDELYAGHHGQIFDGGWCADYPDPENFADVLLHTGAQQNLGGYSNPALDALLEQARVEPDVTRRIALYQQAEQMIVDDAPLLFTVHGLSYVLVKPYVKGYVLTPIDIPIERYMHLGQ